MADADALVCFAVKRGEIKTRADVSFHSPAVRAKLQSLDHSKLPVVQLRTVLERVRYGTSTPPPIVEPSENSVPFVRATDIKNGEVDAEYLLRVEKEQPKAMQKCRLEPGELIIVRSGVNTGDCAVVPRSLRGAYAAYDLILRTRSSVIPDFIAQFLDTEIGRLQLNLVKGRAAQPHINAEEVSAIRIVLPSAEIQQKLVAEMQAAREARNKKLRDADSLLASLGACVLEALGLTLPSRELRLTYSVPRSDVLHAGRCDPQFHAPYYQKLVKAFAASPYPNVELGSISPQLVGGATPTRGDTALYDSGGIKFLRILNVKSNEFDLADLNYIRPEVHEGELKRSQLKANDVLLTITGRVGNAAVVTPDLLPANINQHLVRVRVERSDVSPEYLAAYLNSSVGLAFSNRGVTGGTRIALDYALIRTLEIPVPPIPIQESIVAEVHTRRQESSRLRAEANRDWASAKQKFEEQLLKTDQ